MNFFKAVFASNSITAEEAHERIRSEKAPLILDVRRPDEFRAGHIKGAKLIPLNELVQRMNELPQDRELLCVCRSGSRSGAAVGQLSRAGYTAWNLRGGMISWQNAGYPVKRG